jgi:translation initiation factor 4E
MSELDGPLESTWMIYYDSGLFKGMSKEEYEGAVSKPLGSFSTIVQFWSWWANLKLDKLPQSFNLRFFRKGVRPIWEDQENINGGKWVFQTAKNNRIKLWGDIVLSLIGEQFRSSILISGVVFTSKPNYDMLQIWNQRICSEKTTQRVIEKLRMILEVESNFKIEYQSHKGTIEMIIDKAEKPRPISPLQIKTEKARPTTPKKKDNRHTPSPSTPPTPGTPTTLGKPQNVLKVIKPEKKELSGAKKLPQIIIPPLIITPTGENSDTDTSRAESPLGFNLIEKGKMTREEVKANLTSVLNKLREADPKQKEGTSNVFISVMVFLIAILLGIILYYLKTEPLQ